jgi:hypothetical protein
MRVSGSPDLDSAQWHGLPVDVDTNAHIEVLGNPTLETFWPRFCKMLETTRSRRLTSRYDEWKRREGRQRINRAQKEALARNLSATTLFDFLWRLRVRANYQDVESFLMSNVGPDWQQELYEGLCLITETTCLLLENLIVRRTGRATYEEAYIDFRDGGGPLAQAVVGRRADQLLS